MSLDTARIIGYVIWFIGIFLTFFSSTNNVDSMYKGMVGWRLVAIGIIISTIAGIYSNDTQVYVIVINSILLIMSIIFEYKFRQLFNLFMTAYLEEQDNDTHE